MKTNLRKATMMAAIKVARAYKGIGMSIPPEVKRILKDYRLGGRYKHLNHKGGLAA